ncbi:glutathione S-transferase family protein [Histidinibacterium lentulum]|uniref:Glutathione S-transferase family protein n=1 Tax=Histidinibacterium lentulum TaxID=2480588 RepID=A0A3N2R1T4_9RHOB|nr:glutathione S-transferase family protein [Histidinibacterium lentulum]ROU01308.1 glutathione S-transferase family protein [Histidinibacterium lentulum]
MLTLYHSPHSRSTTITAALCAMGVADRVETRLVTIPRVDGSGGRDPANPHPEGKVPLLVHDSVEIWERGAILAYLSELFPDAEAICPPGHPERGTFLSLLAWYGAVMEPVLICEAAGVRHEWITAAIRGPGEVAARLSRQLRGRDWLLDCGYTVADTLLHGPFAYFPEAVPDDPAIRAWVARCAGHPASVAALEQDSRALASA